MNSLIPASTIHYFDPGLRRILCGLPGFQHRSTKHSRFVTCDACVGLLRERLAMASTPSSTASGSAGP